MKRKVLSIVSSLLILALTLNFTPVLAKDVTMVKPDNHNILVSEGEPPIQHPTGPELTPEIDYMDYDFPKITPGHFELEEESSAEREYIPPSPEDLAETARTVQSFDCSTVTDIPEIECEALVALYESTNGAGWYTKSNWLATDTVGNWYGITVASGYVTLINLHENNLIGSIPPELGNLSKLVELDLYYNNLSGSIPSALGNLNNLQRLYLFDNQLSGSIPSALGSLSNLLSLELCCNQLSGSIPLALGNLSNLELIDLRGNQLSGSIPLELGNLNKLQNLWLFNNQLSGSIPSALGNLSALQYLDLSGNQLSGNIPAELGDLSNLVYLHLFDNKLSGSIPPDLGNLSELRVLWLLNNQLSGSIPSALGNLNNLELIDLRGNQLSGGIPPELGNLSKLRVLFLLDNQLSGSIPLELGSLSALQYLDLSGNQLNGTIPSEFGDLTNLEFLNLAQNLLIGDVPASFTNLVNLCTPDITDYPCYGEYGLDLGYNHLNVPAPDPLAGFLAIKDPDWYLTQAVEEIIDPEDGGDLVSYDESTEVTVPPGAVSEEATFLLFPQPSPSQETGILDFAGNSFELTARDANGPITTFTEPLTITLHYVEASLGVIQEDSLALHYWDESQSSWLDAVTTCPDGEYTRNLEEDWLSVPICHLSEFALMGESNRLYLPLITR